MVENLDELLTKRRVPLARSNLAERIIAAAGTQKPVRAGFDFGKWAQEFFESFALPQPALALGIVLMLGVYMGVNIEASAEEPVAENLAAYLDMNDDGETK
jgi:hypothetical protein